MNWLTNTLGSSIGKKLLMASTGFCFMLFLVVHLAGNLTLYGGQTLFYEAGVLHIIADGFFYLTPSLVRVY